jgi:hypothetical protein
MLFLIKLGPTSFSAALDPWPCVSLQLGMDAWCFGEWKSVGAWIVGVEQSSRGRLHVHSRLFKPFGFARAVPNE